jgi:hypothetical protein
MPRSGALGAGLGRTAGDDAVALTEAFTVGLIGLDLSSFLDFNSVSPREGIGCPDSHLGCRSIRRLTLILPYLGRVAISWQPLKVPL